MLAATVAALGAAAAYSAVASSGPTTTPMPSPEPPAEPIPETPTPPSEPAVETPPPEGATAPSLPMEEPEKVMAGGSIGRPPWGIISASSPADAPPAGITSALTSVLGVSYNPKELEQQLILTERQYQQITLEIFEVEQKLTRKKKEYIDNLGSYARSLSDSKKAEIDINFYKKKMEVKELTKERRKQLNDIITNKDKTDAEKQAAKDELAAGTSGKQEDAKTLNDYREKYAEAFGAKAKADDEVFYAERDKKSYQAEYDSMLKKRDELKQTLKDIGEKRKEVLLKLQAQVLKEPKLSLMPDWQVRLQTYAQAIKARKAAEDNLRIFLTETWNPLEGVDSNREQKFGVPKEQLTQAWKDAKAREERARIALTTVKTPDETVGSVLSDFNAFVSDIEQLTTQAEAVNADGSIKDDWAWNRPDANVLGIITGYPKAVKDLKDAVKNSQLQGAAEFYYKLSKLSPKDLADNLPTLLDRLQKLTGSLKTGGPEGKLKFNRTPFTELTKNLTKIFSYSLLELAANSVRAFPGRFATLVGYDVNDPKQKLYSDLRDKTNAFVDKQLYSIKKVKSLITEALSAVGRGSKKGKDLLELQGKFEELFPLPPTVPSQGRCEMTLKNETFKILKSGKYKDKDILTEVLGGSDDELKEGFLRDIGFASITNFREAQIHAGEINPDTNRLRILRAAAMEEYVKQAEQLARQNPNGRAWYRGNDANNDIARIVRDLTSEQLIALPPYFTPPTAGTQVADPGNKTRADALRAVLIAGPPTLKFTPSIYLKGYNLETTGQRPNPLIETLIPIDDVRKACELDGNVGQGAEQTDRILKIVAALKGLTEPTKEERNPLTDFVDFLKTKRIIDDRGQLQDKSRPFTTLATRGFNEPGIGPWRLMEVSKKDKKTNAVQTFLTLHSAYFRSVGYDESAIYKGKREADIRKKYTEFAIDLLKKEYDIEADDNFWKKIGDEFDMNFTIYKTVDGRGVADQSLDTRPGVAMYNIYQTSDGFYYPIAMTNEAFEAAAPIAISNPALGLRLRQQPFGGAIEGVEVEVGLTEAQEKKKKETGVLLQSALKEGQKRSEEQKKQLEAIKLEGRKAFESIPADDRLPLGLSADNKELIEDARTSASKANTALINSVELADANTHRDTIMSERDAIQQILINYRKMARAAPAPAPVAVEGDPDPDNPFGQKGGGRRRTNNAWLRSKPVRYTRRKFYK